MTKPATATATEVLEQLDALGTEQNRKVYGRHGVTGPAFGVSYANLGKLRKQFGTNQKLAEGLWVSGNHDARVLATMLADPAAVSQKTLDAWLVGATNYVLADALAKMAAESPHAARYEKWIASKNEFVAAMGWTVVGVMADSLDDEVAGDLLKRIEAGIHAAPNRTRHSMNNALISIGAAGGNRMDEALAAAARIGKVVVDHGQTSCKTPDAAAYIRKTVAHRATKKKTTKKAPKKPAPTATAKANPAAGSAKKRKAAPATAKKKAKKRP